MRTGGSCRRGFSLIEVLVALGLLGVLSIGAWELASSGWRMEDQLSTRIGFQSDAQRALAQLIQDVQEGITVVQPLPGSTLPHLVVRDRGNRLLFYALTREPGEEGFRLVCTRAGPSGAETREVLRGVARLTFTALSDGAVMLHLALGRGTRRYAIHTQIRLRNRDALEFQ